MHLSYGYTSGEIKYEEMETTKGIENEKILFKKNENKERVKEKEREEVHSSQTLEGFLCP